MKDATVSQVLARVRAAADAVYHAWPTMQWHRISGPGADLIEQNSRTSFVGLRFEPGQDLVLRSQVQVDGTIGGISVVGEPLELTIFSIYALDLRWNGTRIFAEQTVPLAAGPALVQVIPALRHGDNGELLAHIHVPTHQTIPWFHLTFTTPGLRERFELLDLLWAQLALAEAFASTADEQALVVQAAERIPQALLSLEQSALREALERCEQDLASLAPTIHEHQVHVIGHSHIDMNWLWTWPDTVEVIKRDIASVVSIMDDYPELCFTHSQPATYEVIRQDAPDLFARIVEFIRQGRWEPATMTWVEGDVNMASGEALARHLLEGVSYSREHLGISPTTFLAPDTFGHAGNLPQLAHSAGAQRYYHHRSNPEPGDYWPAYWWEGQDGSRLLTMSTLAYNGNIQARDLATTAIHAHQHGLASSLHFHGIGDHGGGPARHNLDALRRFQQRPLLPVARCSTLETYTRELLATGVELPVHRGESRTIFEGCYTSHADTKYYNRQGENLLTTAETLAALTRQDHSEQLQTAWRTVLFNQFHDILDGSAIHETYEDQAREFAEVQATAQATTQAALQVLESGLPSGSIAITNPLSWDREDWVVVPGKQGSGPVWLLGTHGHRTPGQWTAEGLGFIARVPAFATVGYELLTDEDEAPEPLRAVRHEALPDEIYTDFPQEFSYLKVETDDFRVYLRENCGILTSFFDKRVGRELVGYGSRKTRYNLDAARVDLALNVLQLIEEHPHVMSAWYLHEVHSEQSLLRGATTSVVEEGPVRLVIEVRHRLRSSTIVQQIIFYRELARVDFQTTLDWQERGSPEVGIPNLKVAFTASLLENEAWFETPFAAVQRPANGQEVPALRWADVGGNDYGIALLNDRKYGYDALGSRLRLSLVRSSYEPDSIPDLGEQTLRYSLVPHSGNWRDAGIVQAAAGFNQPLLVRERSLDPAPAREETGWQPSLTPATSVLIAGLKLAQQRDGRIIRLYESAGRSATVQLHGLPATAQVWETTVVEDPCGELANEGGSLSLDFSPWQVRTILVKEP